MPGEKARKQELRQAATERLDTASKPLQPSNKSTFHRLQQALEVARRCWVDVALVEQVKLENDLIFANRRCFLKRIETALENAEYFVHSLVQGHGRNLPGLRLQMKLAGQKVKEEELQVEEVVSSLVAALRNGGKCKK